VFKYDDPKVLSEIDSVFVTLEPPGKNPTEPKGDKFLYAYLRNQANHPKRRGSRTHRANKFL